MSKIKVTVKSISQANEIIEYWSDKGVELFIEVRENTTAENSDVKRKPSRTTVVQCGKLIELD